MTVPTLDLSECKSLLGGCGYGYSFDLPEIIVTPEEEYTDWDDRYSQLEEEFSRTDDHSSSEDCYHGGGSDVENTENNSQGQGEYAYACVFAAVYEVLRRYGNVPTGMTEWLDIAKEHQPNAYLLDSILKETGLNNIEKCNIIDKYFDINRQGERILKGPDNLFMKEFFKVMDDATDGRPVLVSLGVDSDGDRKLDVGHMVVVLGKGNDSYIDLKYWDPAGVGGIKIDTGQIVRNVTGYWEVSPKPSPK